jgi:bifunctional non-homologous end joining protein LigD
MLFIKKQPDFISPELATLTNKYFSKKDWIYEEKFDGIRCIVVKKDKTITLFTRNHNKLNSTFPELAEEFKKQKVKNFILDGEIVAFERGKTSFSKLQQVKRKKIKVYFYVFDLMYFEKYDLTNQKLIDRKKVLKQNFQFSDIFRYTTHIEEKGEDFYQKACTQRLEGIMAKNKNSKYLSKRTKDWLKFKCCYRQEFVIAGYTDPEGSRIGFGSLLIGYFEKGIFKYAGKVGTGYDFEFLKSFSQKLKMLEVKKSPFLEKISEKKKHFVKLKYVAEIGFSEWTKEKKLRHPRFIGLRIDKNFKEVVREVGK